MKRNHIRNFWSRRSLAAKLTLSYAGAIVAIGLIVGTASAVGIRSSLRRQAEAVAMDFTRNAATFVDQTATAYLDSVLVARVTFGKLLNSADGLLPGSVGSPAPPTVPVPDLYVLDNATPPVVRFIGSGEPSTVARAAILASRETLLAESPGFHEFAPFRFYSEPAGAGLLVVGFLDPASETVPPWILGDSLEMQLYGGTVAAAILDSAGSVIVQRGAWSSWAVDSDIASANVAELQRLSADSGRHHIFSIIEVPTISGTVATVFDANAMGIGQYRPFAIMAISGILTLVVVVVVSRITARLITRPVHRAADRLVSHAPGDAATVETVDELSSLVRSLMRTSVKLQYESKRRERAEDELVISSTVFHNTGEGIIILDAHARVSRTNPAFEEISGRRMADMRDHTPDQLVPPEELERYKSEIWGGLQANGEWAGEIKILRTDGETIPVLLSMRAVSGHDDHSTHYIGVVRDISDIRSTQDRLEHLATHDPLTNLSNRTYLSDWLERVVRERHRRGGRAAVLFVDVDHFKDVNDTHGHHAGDELLKTLANRLRAAIRGEDTISRFGGDEFVIVVSQVAEIRDLDEMVRRMQNAVREPATVGGIVVRPSTTIGIAVCPESGTNAEDLLKNADAAMYEAKRISRGSYRYYSPETNESVRTRLAMRDRIRFSLRTGDLLLLWQPVVSVTDGSIVGAEALLRLREGDNLISPDAFMPQIEGSRVVIELARWVLDSTAETIAANEDILPPGFRVAVNVTALEILQRDFVLIVGDTLDEHGVSPTRLAVEVTEGAAIRDIPTAIAVIRDLKAMGVKVYLDDFGVGYSSLQYLRELGVDTVKLDKSFLSTVPESETSCSLVRGIIEMSHGLGLETTAEGVERSEQLVYLKTIACDTVQGYHTGRPMEVRKFSRLLIQSANRQDSAP